ncbi:hypothetical protein [Hyperthermus butylicus]|uniref:hypothetical protein n=1 Tax=Hyperthermus butylicus TaxID=54248 RepID=UPI000320958A|nr:hypothetical protein [Hyperthermus butylicus]
MTFWYRPLDLAKPLLEDAEEESMPRKIPMLRSIQGRYGDARICVYKLYFGAPES